MNSMIECLICNETFDEPVILPCCHTICKKHETESVNEKKISCHECNEVHKIPTKGFPANLLARNLIKRKFDRIDLGAEHTAAIESNEYLSDLIDEFTRLRETPELEITETIGKIRNKIDLHREEAKKKIDDDAMELIRELDEYETKCKAGFSADKLVVSNETEELVKSLEREMSEWSNELESFERNVKRLKTIHMATIDRYDKLLIEREKIKKSLFKEGFEKLVKKQKMFCGEKTDALL